MPFQNLPTEILHAIIVLLDAISLISLSQSSTFFRQLINPGKSEFIERLLALECTEAFDAGFVRPSGWLTYAAWNATRWACSGCFRLLSHSHFDNRSLLRRGYRKPAPDAPASNPLTSWVPSLHGKKWGGRVGPYVSHDARRRRYQYHLVHIYEHQEPMTPDAILHMRNAGVKGIKDLTEEKITLCTDETRRAIFDKAMHDLELDDMGTKRHHRRCNECRYQKNPVGRRGTLAFPIQISLSLYFATPVDRYFPKYWEFFENKRPFCQRIADEHFLGQVIGGHWQMYMARCPGCQRWQEIRAFRLGGRLTSWKPVPGHTTWEDETISTSLLDESRCNTCFEKEHGRAELGERLYQWLHFLQGDYLRKLRASYAGTRSFIERNLQLIDHRVDYDEVVKQQLDTLISPVHDMETLGDEEPDHLDPPAEAIAESVKALQKHTGIDLNLGKYVEEQIDIERQWVWVKASMREVQKNPDALVSWALERDGSVQK